MSHFTEMQTQKDTLSIIYDGHCPFCSRYVKWVRLKEAVENVSLVNAREHKDLYKDCLDAGYDLDIGMLALYKGTIYHGTEAVHFLALMTSPVSVFNKLNRLIFSNRIMSKILYPLLRLGRNTAIFLKGKSQFSKSSNNES